MFYERCAQKYDAHTVNRRRVQRRERQLTLRVY